MDSTVGRSAPHDWSAKVRQLGNGWWSVGKVWWHRIEPRISSVIDRVTGRFRTVP